MMISHLHQNAHALIADVTENLPCRFPHARLSSDSTSSGARFPYFEVESFHKVIGHDISEDALKAFDLHPPLTDDIRDLIALGNDWDAPVKTEFRDNCTKRNWILGTTGLEPGGIKAVMTIYLDYPVEIQAPLSDFEAHILPQLKAHPSITSIYEGVGHRLPIHYILRIDCEVDALFLLIQEIHEAAVKSRLRLSTNTYVVVRKWSNLNLVNCLISTEIPSADARYRDRQIFPHLSPEEKIQCMNLTVEEQTELVATYRTLMTLIRYLTDKDWIRSFISRVEGDLALGLFKKDYTILMFPHNLLLNRTEANLKLRIEELLPHETDLDIHKQATGIQSGKTKQKLTYTERLQVLIQCCKEGVADSLLLPDLQQLFEQTVGVRNAMAHSDWNKLTIRSYGQALVSHCEFLRHWDDDRLPVTPAS